jgi:two-component system chemotaxis response regulator CheY
MSRVLIVDDAAFMRRVLSDALIAAGHEVVGEAGDGDAALAAFQELRPQLVTLDITMPEKDGLATLRELIEIDPDARVVICSALGQESKVLDAIKAGAKDFVVKPFDADRLLSAVSKAVAA